MDDRRNLITAAILIALILFGWPYLSERLFPTPKRGPAEVATPAPRPVGTAGPASQASRKSAAPEPVAATRPQTPRSLQQALTNEPRIQVRTPKLSGSIALTGARIDDMVLLQHRETLAKNSPPVRLFAPPGTPHAYYARFGWTGQGVRLPDENSVWRASGPLLSPGRPITLQWDNGAGQVFQQVLSIDPDYLISVDQRVVNRGPAPVAVTPYGFISRAGKSADPSSWTIHVGPMGVFDGVANYHWDWKDVAQPGDEQPVWNSTGGWIGFTDKYWLTALIPQQAISTAMRMRSDGQVWQTRMARSQPLAVAPGTAGAVPQRLFVGAKEVTVLDRYTDGLGITKLDHAIDWGWFRLIEKPFFYILDFLFKQFGNFGLAIIGLTFIVRAVLFPVGQKQFRSMAQMRAVAPKQKAIQEKYKGDKQRAQMEVMKLYKEEKVNPLAGCLPIVLQIPIFFALYKVLSLSIEMRHQPFVLWIRDLSVPDPLTPVNLFGLLPFHPPAMLAIGILPILLGITMYLMQKLNPPAPDPVQQQMFMLMPWMMMFFFAPLAAGLQVYYVTNNLLSIAQQRFLYSRHPGLREAAIRDAEAKRKELAEKRARA